MESSTTPLFFKSDPRPDPTPKTRIRRGGRAQKGPTKTPQRGMGVERLELEIQRQKGSSPTHRILAAKMYANNRTHGPPLPGVPVHPYPVPISQYYFPGQPDPSTIRVMPMGPTEAVELPSMPNLVMKEALSYKKKRVNGEEENEGVIGFGKGKEKQHVDYDQSLLLSSNGNYYGVNYGGFDANYNNNNNGDYYHQFAVNNGAFPVYYDFTATGSDQVMGIQRKWSQSNVMEYGFFPENSNTGNEEENIKDYEHNNNNKNGKNNSNKNYYLKSMDYLDLKLGCSDSSYASSPSSSLTTATTTTAGASDTSLDLSLKLSNY